MDGNLDIFIGFPDAQYVMDQAETGTFAVGTHAAVVGQQDQGLVIAVGGNSSGIGDLFFEVVHFAGGNIFLAEDSADIGNVLFKIGHVAARFDLDIDGRCDFGQFGIIGFLPSADENDVRLVVVESFQIRFLDPADIGLVFVFGQPGGDGIVRDGHLRVGTDFIHDIQHPHVEDGDFFGMSRHGGASQFMGDGQRGFCTRLVLYRISGRFGRPVAGGQQTECQNECKSVKQFFFHDVFPG